MKTIIVSEIASNWEGNVSKAKKLIEESKRAGADAVKFQMWRAKDLYQNHPNLKIIKKSELTFKKAKQIKKFADKVGIEFFCSAFYPEAPCMKIADESYAIDIFDIEKHLKLVKKLRKKNKIIGVFTEGSESTITVLFYQLFLVKIKILQEKN